MKRSPLRRKKPMIRGTSRLTRRTRLRARNTRRSVTAWARAYHSVKRVEFVKSLPCAICRHTPPPRNENAHTKNDGAGRKGHYTTIIPACQRCHRISHAPNGGWSALLPFTPPYRRAWLDTKAAETEAAWQAQQKTGDTRC